MLRIADAKEGKIWKSKLTGDILSNRLYLGINDSIDNYEEVDEIVEEVVEQLIEEQNEIIEETNN